ncbi:hypothetical protein [Paraburkholderia flava]|uniref:hypothetical protein n=1 Tax=Paraburkholderia flava TaxID=2547393 RepID=UPI0010607A10|nr:hypothetical protein [Paraburkholderia flava]
MRLRVGQRSARDVTFLRRALATLALTSLTSLTFALLPCTAHAAAADDHPDPDACTLVQNADADVAALIAPAHYAMRVTSSHPAPGKSSCVWLAHEKGLTDDAPPSGTLSLDYYHFADAARARRHTRELGDAVPPFLTRTDDTNDRLIRVSHDEILALHGADAVVVHAETAAAHADRPDWTTRLETLAFTAAGAHVLGPANDKAAADLCAQIDPQHVLALLTLTPSTLTADAGSATRCRFDVKDASGKPNGWVDNKGDATFERSDFGNHAAALKRQHDDTPFYPESHAVRTADPTDRVLVDPQHPESVSAVHGPYLVDLNVSNATAAARATPGWDYRVQRTALEAAGATVIPQPGMPPDPVVPGPNATPAPSGWHPAAYTPPAIGVTLAPVLHMMWTLASWRFYLMPAGVVFFMFFGALLRRRLRHMLWIIPLGIALVVLNLVVGVDVSVRLVHRFGEQGQATIVGRYGTSTVYNHHHVIGYNVLVRTADGKIVETSFEDDDFNVYPPHNATTYPQRGDEFTVRYPAGFPHDFVIVSDDDSPWARQLNCSRLARTAGAAAQKQQFAPDSAAYRDASAAAERALRAAGCDDDQ